MFGMQTTYDKLEHYYIDYFVTINEPSGDINYSLEFLLPVREYMRIDLQGSIQ